MFLANWAHPPIGPFCAQQKNRNFSPEYFDSAAFLYMFVKIWANLGSENEKNELLKGHTQNHHVKTIIQGSLRG